MGIFPGGHRISLVHFHRKLAHGLQRNLGMNLPCFCKRLQITVQMSQVSLNIQVTVQIDIGIFRAVISLVEFFKGGLGQIGNCLRQTAGLKPVRRIRKQHLGTTIGQQGIRRRINALHLIINYAVISQPVFRTTQFVMPAFLF